MSIIDPTEEEDAEVYDGFEYVYEEEDSRVEGKPAAWLVLVLLGAVTGVAIGALAYGVAINGDQTALATLGNIAMIGVGALTALLGGKGTE